MKEYKMNLLNLFEDKINAQLDKAGRGKWELTFRLKGKDFTTSDIDEDDMQEFISLVSSKSLKTKLKPGAIEIESKKITKDIIDNWLF